MIRKRYACRTTSSRSSQREKKSFDAFNSVSMYHGNSVHKAGAYPHSFNAHCSMGWSWGSRLTFQGIYTEGRGLRSFYLHSFHDSYYATTHEAMRRN